MAAREIDPKVRSFFESYRSAFEALGPPKIADHFIYPCSITGDSAEVAPQSIASRADWILQLDQLVAGYKAIGFSSARILELSAIKLSPRLIQAAVRWQLVNAAQQAIYDFQAVYTLVQRNGQFRIAAIAHNETPRFLEAIKKASR